MLVIDGNGQSEIVSLFLTFPIIDMINAFKSANPSWSKVGVVITDRFYRKGRL